MKRQERFSLRKKKVGLCSVILGIALVGGTPVLVHADGVNTASSPALEAVVNHSNVATTEVANSESTTEKAPVIDVVSLEVDSTTETKTTVIPATTEYRLDENKDAGQIEVVREAKDGQATSTTKGIVQTDYDALVDPKVKNDTNRYITEDFYHIDKTKERPSDQVVIDKLYQTLPADLSRLDLGTSERSPRELVAEDEGVYGQVKVKYKDKDYKDKGTTVVVPQEYFDYELTHDKNSKFEFNLSYTTPIINYLPLNANKVFNIARGSYLTKLIPLETGDADDLKRYFSAQYITDGLYADAKAAYMRAQDAKARLESFGKEKHINFADLTSTWNAENDTFDKYMSRLDDAFDTITQRYNNSKGYYGQKVEYKNATTMTSEERQIFEANIQKLPLAIRQNILKLYVTDDALPAAKETDIPVGITLWLTKLIGLRHNKVTVKPIYELEIVNGKETAVKKTNVPVKQPDRMTSVLLHELSHVVDFHSGLTENYTQVGFSDSDEFKAIYKTYFKGKVVAPYYRDHIEEAFADSLGGYIELKIFGIQPERYIKRLDEKGEEQIITLVEGDALYNSPEAYSPLLTAEAETGYYSKLYARLFEDPKVVKYSEGSTETKVEPQNGLVIYGAKPSEKTVTTPFKVVYKSDDSKDFGYVAEVGGINGETVIRTTYKLTNNKPEAVETVLKENAPVDKVVTKGTKASTTIVDRIPSKVRVIEDANLDKGVERADEKQVGSEGYTTVTTTYTLNPETGEVTATETRVVTPMTEKVLYVGTKEVAEPVKPESKPETKPVLKPEVKDDNKSVAKPVLVTDTKTDVQLVTTVVSATAQATTDVISRRGVTDYQAALPQTGEGDAAVYSLLGLGMLGLAGVATRKRQGN